MKILVVEDDGNTAPVLDRALKPSGYVVHAMSSGSQAVQEASHPETALVVIDLDIAGEDGMTVLDRLSALDEPVPVVVLAQREAVEGDEQLDDLAPDVVTKPASARDVVTRVRVRLQQSRRRGRQVMRAGVIRLDLEARRAFVHGHVVRLSNREFALLRALMRDPGRVLSREQLLEQVWGIDFAAQTNVVSVYVAYLRRKLGRASIETVRGQGYRMAG